MLRPMRPDLRSGKVKRKEIFNCTLENPSVRGRRLQLRFCTPVQGFVGEGDSSCDMRKRVLLVG